MTAPLRIAIDGPSGAGKSTLGRALARKLGLPYVDTGAMYRALAWAVIEEGLESAEAIVARLDELDLAIDPCPNDFRVSVDGRDVTALLRQPEVSRAAAEVAKNPAVRDWMLPLQVAAARHGGVLEGRDIGTVVLPDADFKFFVTSDEKVRMERRAAQLGVEHDGDAVRAEVRDRDRIDRNRDAAPLVAATDAITIDTSAQNVEESLASLLATIARAP